jgi:hypothetical protein
MRRQLTRARASVHAAGRLGVVVTLTVALALGANVFVAQAAGPIPFIFDDARTGSFTAGQPYPASGVSFPAVPGR